MLRIRSTASPKKINKGFFADENTKLRIRPNADVHKHVKGDYLDGGHGFIDWCEDNVRVPIYPEGATAATWCPIKDLPREKNPITGRSYRGIWEEQKRIFIEALRMKKGRFVYRTIVLCWMRGEGKSLIACLIQLWKFFNFPRQQIMLGANSRDQVKFVHYDIMRDIILNSPNLVMAVGTKNIQEKEIRLRDEKGRIVSIIRSISSFSGIVSNITGFTFSEIFDMKNPKFFVQLDGSTRNIPNALGVIDSTVSEKTHVLYKLYTAASSGKTTTVYFSYRSSPKGKQEDYWNPHMTQEQLDDYKAKFPFGEFERYFQNLWTAGRVRVLTDIMIEEMGVIGARGSVMNHADVLTVLKEKEKIENQKKVVERKGLLQDLMEKDERIKEAAKPLKFVDEVYQLKISISSKLMTSLEDLNRIGDLLDTDWIVGAGIDMSDPMAIRSAARTVLIFVAKGLPGSRSRPYIYTEQESAPKYVYFVLHVEAVKTHSLNDIKVLLEEAHDEYLGIDVICGERWGIWDLESWCEERDILLDALYPTYARQREAFKEIYDVFSEGRIKSPVVPLVGSKGEDILREEASIFDHDPDRRWFGSPEKAEKSGVQDDVMYGLAWGLYGGRMLGAADLRPRIQTPFFGMFLPNQALQSAA